MEWYKAGVGETLWIAKNTEEFMSTKLHWLFLFFCLSE